MIVPDTKQGERVQIRISDVQKSVAFAEVVERVSYYDYEFGLNRMPFSASHAGCRYVS